jgi:hypothetical protein
MSPPTAAPSLAAYIAGSRLSDASFAMRGYSENNIGLEKPRARRPSFDHGGECVFDIVRTGRWHEYKLYSECFGRAFDLLQHARHCAVAVCTRMQEDCHARELRHGLSEQL